jgi:hypothetical protein
MGKHVGIYKTTSQASYRAESEKLRLSMARVKSFSFAGFNAHMAGRVHFIVANTLFGILATTSYLGSTNSAMSYFSVEAKSIATSLSLSL